VWFCCEVSSKETYSRPEIPLTEAKQNPEIEPVDPVKDPEPGEQPVQDPGPQRRSPVNDPQPGSPPEPDAPEPEPPHGDPPSQEPGVNTAPPLVLTAKPVPEEKSAKAAAPKAKKE